MRLTLTRSVLRDLLQLVRRTVTRSKHLPVLNHLRFARDASGVTVTATDLSRTLRHRLPPESWSGAEGAFLVSLEDLTHAVKGHGGTMALEVQSPESVVLTTEIAGTPVRRTLSTLPAEEFPACEIPTPEMVSVDAQALFGAYRLAVPYVSRDDNRGVLQGVFIENRQQRVVATDGRRLTVLDIPETGLAGDFVLPVVPLLAGKLEGPVRIGFAEGPGKPVFRLDTPDWTLAVACIEGAYPNYRQVIPPENIEGGAVFDFSAVPAGVLHEALGQFRSAKGDPVLIYGDRERVVLSGGNGTRDRLMIPLSGARCECAEWIAVGVNPEFFEEPLRQGFTRMEIANESSPLRFTGSVRGTHVLMPMHGGNFQELREAITGVPAPQSEPPEPIEPEVHEAPVKVPEEIPPETLGSDSPRKAFHTALEAVAEAVRTANQAARVLKGTARELDRHYREQVRWARKARRHNRPEKPSNPVPLRAPPVERVRAAS